ncbi:hypothetical protein E2562_007116 [Oryza meyeriana var. granulata]|uniref:F-box associated domain-containing protein n=1 Tax=Oryza meyeriana var. granulata TaxID=110450 RepID=A0A6G1F536_9ORYZ|nr:hypothetical protein E2562_007116 [Oryza meyeriana var. granulata]
MKTYVGLSNEISFYCLREPLGKYFDNTKAELMLQAVRLEPHKFGLVQFPPGCHRGDLVELARKLFFVHTANEDTFGIWQLADDGSEPAWLLHCRVTPYSKRFCYGFFPVLSRGRKMLLSVDNEKLY